MATTRKTPAAKTAAGKSAAMKKAPAVKAARTAAPAKTVRRPAAPADGADTGQRLRALHGRAAAGRAMTADEPASRAPAAPELRESRPYTSRYPISNDEFLALKADAPTARLGKVQATLAVDRTPRGGAAARPALTPLAMSPGMGATLAPAAAANFDGIAATGWLPPDCTLAAGPNHVLLSVNSSVAIHAKAGGAALLSRTLSAWFSNVAQGLTVFDPKALYDQHAGRWVLLAVAFSANPNRSVFLLSVSRTADPLGAWLNYSMNAMADGGTATNNWADYPGLGVDNQCFYFTANMFAFGGGFAYSKVRVVPKAGPYAGAAAPFVDFVRLKNADGQLAFTVTPCHTYGAPQVEYLVNSAFPSGNKLTLWHITGPVGAPVMTRATVGVSNYSLPPNAQQKGGGTPLNSGDVRVLHAVFRGDSVWAALTTAHQWTSAAANRAAVHWFQIRGANGTLVQEGIYGSASQDYFYPAPCPDNNGNMMMVFSRSGSAEFAGVRYTGRKSNDPLGQLQSSALLQAGVANYKALDSGGRNRWGDYAGIASDPANPRLVWFYSGYANPANAWATRVGSALF